MRTGGSSYSGMTKLKIDEEEIERNKNKIYYFK